MTTRGSSGFIAESNERLRRPRRQELRSLKGTGLAPVEYVGVAAIAVSGVEQEALARRTGDHARAGAAEEPPPLGDRIGMPLQMTSRRPGAARR